MPSAECVVLHLYKRFGGYVVLLNLAPVADDCCVMAASFLAGLGDADACPLRLPCCVFCRQLHEDNFGGKTFDYPSSLSGYTGRRAISQQVTLGASHWVSAVYVCLAEVQAIPEVVHMLTCMPCSTTGPSSPLSKLCRVQAMLCVE